MRGDVIVRGERCAIGGGVLTRVDVISDSGDCAIVTASSRHGVISELRQLELCLPQRDVGSVAWVWCTAGNTPRFVFFAKSHPCVVFEATTQF